MHASCCMTASIKPTVAMLGRPSDFSTFTGDHALRKALLQLRPGDGIIVYAVAGVHGSSHPSGSPNGKLASAGRSSSKAAAAGHTGQGPSRTGPGPGTPEDVGEGEWVAIVLDVHVSATNLVDELTVQWCYRHADLPLGTHHKPSGAIGKGKGKGAVTGVQGCDEHRAVALPPVLPEHPTRVFLGMKWEDGNVTPYIDRISYATVKRRVCIVPHPPTVLPLKSDGTGVLPYWYDQFYVESCFFTLEDIDERVVPACHQAEYAHALAAGVGPPPVTREERDRRASEVSALMARLQPGHPGAPHPSQVDPAQLLPVTGELHALEIASGCGGMSADVQHAGCRVSTKWAVDMNKNALATLLINRPDSVVEHVRMELYMHKLLKIQRLMLQQPEVGIDMSRSVDEQWAEASAREEAEEQQGHVAAQPAVAVADPGGTKGRQTAVKGVRGVANPEPASPPSKRRKGTGTTPKRGSKKGATPKEELPEAEQAGVRCIKDLHVYIKPERYKDLVHVKTKQLVRDLTEDDVEFWYLVEWQPYRNEQGNTLEGHESLLPDWDVEQTSKWLVALYLERKRATNSLPLWTPASKLLIRAGLPCQGSSKANRARATTNVLQDPRNGLVKVFVRLLGVMRELCGDELPAYLLLENVPGTLEGEEGMYVRFLYASLSVMRYQLRLALLPAGGYGTATVRYRMYLFAAAPGRQLPPIPAPSHALVDNTRVHLGTWVAPCHVTAEHMGDRQLHPPNVLGDLLSDLPCVSATTLGGTAKYELAPTRPLSMYLRRLDTGGAHGLPQGCAAAAAGAAGATAGAGQGMAQAGGGQALLWSQLLNAVTEAEWAASVLELAALPCGLEEAGRLHSQVWDQNSHSSDPAVFKRVIRALRPTESDLREAHTSKARAASAMNAGKVHTRGRHIHQDAYLEKLRAQPDEVSREQVARDTETQQRAFYEGVGRKCVAEAQRLLQHATQVRDAYLTSQCLAATAAAPQSGGPWPLGSPPAPAGTATATAHGRLAQRGGQGMQQPAQPQVLHNSPHAQHWSGHLQPGLAAADGGATVAAGPGSDASPPNQPQGISGVPGQVQTRQQARSKELGQAAPATTYGEALAGPCSHLLNPSSPRCGSTRNSAHARQKAHGSRRLLPTRQRQRQPGPAPPPVPGQVEHMAAAQARVDALAEEPAVPLDYSHQPLANHAVKLLRAETIARQALLPPRPDPHSFGALAVQQMGVKRHYNWADLPGVQTIKAESGEGRKSGAQQQFVVTPQPLQSGVLTHLPYFARDSGNGLSLSRPCHTTVLKTVTGWCDPESGELTHPTQARLISVREAARSQGFDDATCFATLPSTVLTVPLVHGGWPVDIIKKGGRVLRGEAIEGDIPSKVQVVEQEEDGVDAGEVRDADDEEEEEEEDKEDKEEEEEGEEEEEEGSEGSEQEKVVVERRHHKHYAMQTLHLPTLLQRAAQELGHILQALSHEARALLSHPPGAATQKAPSSSLAHGAGLVHPSPPVAGAAARLERRPVPPTRVDAGSKPHKRKQRTPKRATIPTVLAMSPPSRESSGRRTAAACHTHTQSAHEPLALTSQPGGSMPPAAMRIVPPATAGPAAGADGEGPGLLWYQVRGRPAHQAAWRRLHKARQQLAQHGRELHQMVGNAVCPPIALALTRCIALSSLYRAPPSRPVVQQEVEDWDWVRVYADAREKGYDPFLVTLAKRKAAHMETTANLAHTPSTHAPGPSPSLLTQPERDGCIGSSALPLLARQPQPRLARTHASPSTAMAPAALRVLKRGGLPVKSSSQVLPGSSCAPSHGMQQQVASPKAKQGVQSPFPMPSAPSDAPSASPPGTRAISRGHVSCGRKRARADADSRVGEAGAAGAGASVVLTMQAAVQQQQVVGAKGVLCLDAGELVS